MDSPDFMSRLVRWQVGLTLAGAVAWALTRGAGFALSFLVGALAAGTSFWLLHRVATNVSKPKPPVVSAIFAVFRLLLIGGVISAILTTYKLQTGAMATGILVVVVSILLEAVRNNFNGT